jgi:hypothetical protein
MAYVTVPTFQSAAENEGFGDLWGSIVSTAQSIIPAHTVVGNLIGATGAKGPTPAVTPVKPVAPVSPGLLAPGGFLAQNQTVLLLGAAALVAILVLGRMPRRK